MVGHWQPEMSPATQHGASSPVATTDLSLGGLVTRHRPTTGSLSLFSKPLFYPDLGRGGAKEAGVSATVVLKEEEPHVVKK